MRASAAPIPHRPPKLAAAEMKVRTTILSSSQFSLDIADNDQYWHPHQFPQFDCLSYWHHRWSQTVNDKSSEYQDDLF